MPACPHTRARHSSGNRTRHQPAKLLIGQSILENPRAAALAICHPHAGDKRFEFKHGSSRRATTGIAAIDGPGKATAHGNSSGTTDRAGQTACDQPSNDRSPGDRPGDRAGICRRARETAGQAAAKSVLSRIFNPDN